MSVAVAHLQAAPTKTYKWMYQGNYVLGDVLADLCDRTGCSLGISGEVVELPITLSVKTSSPSVLLASLRNALSASGYYLSGSLSGNLSVMKDAFVESSAFVDHTGNVQVVPKLQKSVYMAADSVQAYKDSLSKILPEEIPPKRWRFDFYSVSDLAAKTYGLDFSHPLMYGDISFTHPLENTHVSRSWNLDYLSSLDSLFESRTVSFDLDSSVTFSWGVQKQITDKVIVQDGIQQTSYVWRQYGVDIEIQSFPKLKMSYMLRSPDESTISGSSVLGEDSTIFVVAHYDLNQRGESCFLPFLPIFCKPAYNTEKRYFVLVLYRLPEESNPRTR